MQINSCILYTVIGLISGSFLTVCIDRIPLRQSIVKGRSHCPHCDHRLSYRDMIPVVSWLLLKGKCRYCRGSIAVQYPLIETLNAMLWIVFGIVLHHSFYTVLACCFASILIVLSAIDFHTKEVPLVGLILLLIIGIVAQLVRLHAMTDALLQATVIATPLLLICYLFPGSIGDGDICLLIASAFFLQSGGIFLAAMLGYLLAAVSLLPALWTHAIDRDAKIPMIPFLSVGIIFSILYGTPIIRWYLSLL